MSSTLNVQIGDITPANVAQLKTLNVTTLPVRYSEKFYKDLVSCGNQKYMKFAYWNGFAVGGVCARVEANEGEQQGTSKLYIMTINVLPAYRRRGIGECVLCSRPEESFTWLRRHHKHDSNPVSSPFVYVHSTATSLLKYVLDEAAKETTPSTIQEVYLHVQTSNLEAKSFYESHGFIESGIIEGYYKRIEPPDCFILRRELVAT